MYKIIGADHKEYGPVAADQIRQWIAEGRANAQTKVQAEGSNTWIALAALPEFAALLPKLPPPVPAAIAMPSAAGPVTNKMAVWAFVCGLLSICCCQPIFGPLSIILGSISLGQIKRMGQAGRGFAIAAIILGAFGLVLFVVGVVISMAYPDLLQNLQNALQQQAR